MKIGTDGEGATPVGEVRGKEYSHTNPFVAGAVIDPRLTNLEDHDAFGVPDPLQVVSWDGLAGPIGGNSGSVDSFDYNNSPGFNFPEGQIDALANRNDALFTQVVRNEATLLFSVTGDIGVAGMTGHVHWEAPVGPGAGFGTGHGVWAEIEAPLVDTGVGPGVNHHRVVDVDALEVWGPEPPSHDGGVTPVREGYVGGGPGVGTPTGDADRFSLDVDSASGISVWAYNITTAAITPWVLHSDIVAAVEELFLTPLFGPGAMFDRETRDMIDLDAMMARDIDRELDGTSMAFGRGDELLFSIDPIDTVVVVDADGSSTTLTGLIDGGEIMHLRKTGFGPGTFTIEFLRHGGHLWDTAFDVAGTFGYEFEDVDGLEAVGTLTGMMDVPVPEPSTVLLGGLAALLAGGYRRRARS